jgi:hypothetical protein
MDRVCSRAVSTSFGPELIHGRFVVIGPLKVRRFGAFLVAGVLTATRLPRRHWADSAAPGPPLTRSAPSKAMIPEVPSSAFNVTVIMLSGCIQANNCGCPAGIAG